MHFTQGPAPDGIVMSLHGAFTFKDHRSFRAMLDVLGASAGRRHVLDLSKLEFLDSAALGMLLIADDEARGAGWTVTLRRPSIQIARLLDLASMNEVFTIEA